jgi:hypothetical protein
MRGPSGRLATATAVAFGVAVLAVAGRLLPSVPRAQPTAATAAGSAATVASTTVATQRGSGPTTARYRIVVASLMFDPLSVTLTMPPDADLKVWVNTRWAGG